MLTFSLPPFLRNNSAQGGLRQSGRSWEGREEGFQPQPALQSERGPSSNREFNEPEVVQIAETCGPQSPFEPFGQLVGGFCVWIGVREGFLTDELALRGHEGVLDDEVFLGHRMGCHHLDFPSLHRHLRRMAALLAGPPARRILGIDEGYGEGARGLCPNGTPHDRRGRKYHGTLQKLPSSLHGCSPSFITVVPALNHLFFGVVYCPIPVDKDNALVSDNPSVVSGRQERNVTGPGFIFLPIGHDYMESS
jgi:hypothetical protein